MFVYRYYNREDFNHDIHTGYEVGFMNTEFDDFHGRNATRFCIVKQFADEMDAAEYVHWLNGGYSSKYDNRMQPIPEVVTLKKEKSNG